MGSIWTLWVICLELFLLLAVLGRELGLGVMSTIQFCVQPLHYPDTAKILASPSAIQAPSRAPRLDILWSMVLTILP